jgi:hypothetical protein
LTPLPEKNYDNYYHDYWLYIDLYYPDTKEIVHTWTRPDIDTTLTTIEFVSLSYIYHKTDFRLINRDFSYIANKKQISKFKSKLVDKIQEQIDKKRKSDTYREFDKSGGSVLRRHI